MSTIRLLLTLIIFTAIIIGCTASTNPQNKTNALDFIDPNSNPPGNRNALTNTSAWSAAVTISEETNAGFFGSGSLKLLTNVNNTLFASSEVTFNKSLFFTRTSMNVPWVLSGPDMSSFESVYQTQLINNPKSANVYTTWSGIKLGLFSSYISQYTPASGWSTPLVISENGYRTKVLVADDGTAIILWLTAAENGTTELHGKRFDSQNQLSLMDTIVIGQAGQFNSRIDFFDGWIETNGEVKVYWASNDMNFPVDGTPPTSIFNVWHTTYSLSNTGSNAWAIPEEIPNSTVSVPGFIEDFQFIPASSGDITVVLKIYFSFVEIDPIQVFTIRAGVWSGPLQMPVGVTTNLPILSNVAHDQSGQVVLVYSDIISAEVSPGNYSYEYKVFVTQYNITTGWLPAVQINNSNPITASSYSMGSGDEPKISLNSVGGIAITWINPIEDPRILYANHYDPTSGWHGEELVASTQFPASGQAAYNIALTDDGNISVLWNETNGTLPIPGASPSPGTGGNDVIRKILSVDHVGTGNGAVNITNASTKFIDPTLARLGFVGNPIPNQILRTNLTSQGRIDRLLTLSDTTPISVNNAWDLPTEIGTIIAPVSSSFFSEPLNVNSDDVGQVTVSFFTNAAGDALPFSPDISIWGGDILTGGWFADSPLLPVAIPNNVYINEIEIDPLTGDRYVSWIDVCPNSSCLDAYVSRKSAATNRWEAPVLMSADAGSAVDVVISSSGISAIWKSATDTTGNPTIAYAEFNAVTGWSNTEFYTPIIPAPISTPTPPGNITPLSHDSLRPIISIVNDDGVLSIVTDVYPDLFSNISILIQRDPIDGWSQTRFPLPAKTMSMGRVYLSPISGGARDAVHAIVSEGYSSTETRDVSLLYANGSWGAAVEATAPKKGDIMFSGFDTLIPKDSNSNGEVLIAWNEQVLVDFVMTRQVRVNRYDPMTGWGQAMDVGFSIPSNMPFAPGMIFTGIVGFMRVSLNESGEGAIAWIDFSGVEPALNIVHLDASLAVINHEIVISLDPAFATFSALDLHLDNQGRAILVWDEQSSDGIENTHRIKTTTHHVNGAIAPQPIVPPALPEPLIPTVPKQSLGWFNSEIVIETQSQSNEKNFTQLSAITAMNDKVFITRQVDRDFDSTTNTYASSERKMVSSSEVGLWESQNPYGNTVPDIQSRVQLAVDSNSQSVIALWTSQQQLYMNYQMTNTAWSTPQMIADNVAESYLLSNNQGDIAIVWQAIDEPTSVRVSEVILDASGSFVSSMPMLSTKAESTLAGTPKLSEQGLLVILRSMKNVTNEFYIVSRYQMGTGWVVEPENQINIAGFYTSSFDIAITSDNKILVFAQSQLLRTLHSSLMQADGTWTSWVNIQQGDATPTALIGKYRVGTSSSGHLYVMWVEEVITNSGDSNSIVMFSRFEAANLTAGNPWQRPTLISRIRSPNYHETPYLLVGVDGSAAIIWKQPTIPFEIDSILVRKYQPANGWSPESEIAANFSLSFSLISHLNASISATNDIFIVWETLGTNYPGIPPTLSMTRGKL